jgi:hypothetical protein
MYCICMLRKTLLIVMVALVASLAYTAQADAAPFLSSEGKECDTVSHFPTVQHIYMAGVHCFVGSVYISGPLMIDTIYGDVTIDVIGSVTFGSLVYMEKIGTNDLTWVTQGSVTTGQYSRMVGDINARSGAVTTGQYATVEGNIIASTVTTGQGSKVVGDINARTVTTGESSNVYGCVYSQTLTPGVAANIHCIEPPVLPPTPEELCNDLVGSTWINGVCVEDTVPPVTPISDTDGDGFADDIDLCPDVYSLQNSTCQGIIDDQAYYAQQAILDAEDQKKSSDFAKKQRYLERPSFGINYKTFQEFEQSGITINGVTTQMTQETGTWRIFVGQVPTIYTMDIVVQSEHGIRELTVTPNKVSEKKHNNPERFSALIRDDGQDGDAEVWKTMKTKSTITTDREGDFVTISMVGIFNNSGVMQLELYDNNNERQMLFIHFE